MASTDDLVTFLRQNFKVAPTREDTSALSLEPEEAFGHVTFYGPTQLDSFFSSKYVRFDPRQLSSQQVVLDLLFKHWKLSQPRLIISVTGGARRFIMHNRILHQFNRSLLRAATSADALIVTNGLWKGVTRLIGEAAQSLRYQQGSNRVQLLGIASWGVLQETNALMNNSFVSPLDTKRYRVYDNFENEKVPASLEPNHHAFLLVDNGTFRKYGEEIAFRNELEDLILQQLGGGSEKTPGVLLVLEGGETTLTTTLEFLRKGRPAVVVDGLGGCGDLIAYAYRLSDGMAGEPINSCADFVRFERIMLTECPHWKRYLHFKDNDAKQKAESKMHEANMLLFEACVGRRDNISVVKLTDADRLDSAILEANFKAAQKNSDPLQLLGLAVQWNRSDIATSYVFTGENMSNPAFFTNLNNNFELFLTTMKRNFHESALTLIQHGFNLTGRFLTPSVLADMYAQVLTLDGRETRFVDESLRTVIDQLTRHMIDANYKDDILEVIGEAIADLIRGYFPNIYATKQYAEHSKRVARRGAVSAVKANKMKLAREGTSMPVIKSSDRIGDDDHRISTVITMAAAGGDVRRLPVLFPQRDLFVFCVLLNRQEMALLLLRQFGQGGVLAGALFAAAILKGLASRTGSMVELHDSLIKHSTFWEATASSFVEHCFERNQASAQLLLIRAVPEFGNKTPFQLAHAAELRKFMCSSCCFTKLNFNWRGQMSVTTPLKLITAAAFLPVLIPAIKFRPNFGADGDAFSSAQKTAKVGSQTSVIQPDLPLPKPSALLNVSWRSSSPSHVNLLRAIRLFYRAPVTKFITNTVAYIIYLAIYSIFVLTQNLTSTTTISPYEIVIWVWTGVMALEHLRLIASTSGGFLTRVTVYWSNWWHRIDVLAFLLFAGATICHVIAICFRLRIVSGGAGSDDDNNDKTLSSLDIAVVDLYNLALVAFILRLLSFFYVSQVLGPKIVNLDKIMVDFGFFMAAYLVLLLAFSVPINAILYPGSPFTWEILEVVVYDYFLILFHMFNPDDRVHGRQENCIAYNAADPATYSANLKISQRCPQQNYLAVPLLCAFLLATSVILINLLIAIFSFTFSNVTSVSAAVWRFNMYEFVLGYHNKSALVPPLSVIEHIVAIISYVVEKIKRWKHKNGSDDDDDDEASSYHRHSSSFVLYDEKLPELSNKTDSSLSLRRKAYQLSMLVRFETSSIETFFENFNASA